MSLPVEKLLAALENHGHKPDRSGSSWSSRCPAHEDKNPSLSISEGEEGRALVKCHAGCETSAVISALDLDMKDLFPRVEAKAQIVATYNYVDETGKLLSQVVRSDPKGFRNRRPGGPGEPEWIWNLNGVRRVPYKLPTLLAEGEHAYFVEGEKDSDALTARGLTATTSLGGAGKWRDEYSRFLTHVSKVTVVADRDEPGRAHAREVAASLTAAGIQVEVVQPPDGSKDISDMLTKGLTQNDLEPLPGPRRDADEPTWEGPYSVLLDELTAFVSRFIRFSTDHQLVAVVLWAAHTHLTHRVRTTVYLHVTSPEPESGKSQLLDVLEMVVHNPWVVVLPSPAVLFRKIDKAQDQGGLTLLLDEVDPVFKRGGDDAAEALRAVLNSGHQKGRTVPRCVGPSQKLTDFEVYGAKALAGLGDVPDTIASRSIRIAMKRRKPSEWVEPLFPDELDVERNRLSVGLAQLAADTDIASLRGIRRELLTLGLGDRSADGWASMVALADRAGGSWPAWARNAAKDLSCRRDPDSGTLQVRLLADIQTIWEGEAMFTADLLQRLHALDESPWGDLEGKALTARKLADMLRGFDVRSSSSTIRIGERTGKGYLRAPFEDAWDRYIDKQTVTPSHPRSEAVSDPEQSESVTGKGSPESSIDTGDVTDVTVRCAECGLTVPNHGFACSHQRVEQPAGDGNTSLFKGQE